jgi:hypothetical protein
MDKKQAGSKRFNAQLITDGERWPFVGRAYVNHNGSLTVYLDDGVTLTGGQKLYLRPAAQKPQADSDGAAQTGSNG